jgi:endonuclease G, mitochondrial
MLRLLSRFSTLCWATAAGVITGVPLFSATIAQSQVTVSPHVTLGNPSNAVTSTSYPNNYLLVKSQYATSYSNSRRIPNWVSWQLNRSWLGSSPRQDTFRADTALPTGWYRVTGSDYSGSGFDRGHMTPSADRTASVTDNSATFLMTNMIPQAPDNNQGVWEKLESYERDLVTTQGKELYIIAGSYGNCGTGSTGFVCSFQAASNRAFAITVPARTWKVIVVLDRPGAGVSGVSTSTRVIAVDIPNTQGVRNADWRSYRVSVDTLEQRTGYDFLSLVPTSIQSVLEARIDNQ